MIQRSLSFIAKCKPYAFRRSFQIGAVAVVVLVAGITAAFSRTPATIHTEQTAQHQKSAAQQETSNTNGAPVPQADSTSNATSDHPASSTGKPAASPSSSPGSSAHSLSISPAAITVYKMPGTPIQGGRFNDKEMGRFTIAADDGKPITYPRPDDISAGFSSSSGGANYLTSWNMSLGTYYISLGTHTYTFTAKSQGGQTYTGSIRITAVAAPYFSTSTNPLTTNTTAGQTHFAFTGFQADFSHINENDIDVYTSGNQNISVSEVDLYEDEIDLTTTAPVSNTAYFYIVLESDYQHVEIPAQIVGTY